jgi:hypothetical protein
MNDIFKTVIRRGAIMKMLAKLLVLVVVLFATSVYSATLIWENDDGSHLWNDPNNWELPGGGGDAGRVPTINDEINTWLAAGLSDYILVRDGDLAICQDFIFGPDGRNVKMVIDGGYFQFRNMFCTRYDSEVHAEMVINGGVVTAKFDGTFGGRIVACYSSNPLSTCKITQYGGEVIMDDALVIDTGTTKFLYELKGGVFDAKYIASFGGPENATIDITNGLLIYNNLVGFKQLVALGYITIGGEPAVETDFNYDLETYNGVRVGITVKEPPLRSDLNGDNVVDFTDFAIMASEWLLDRR